MEWLNNALELVYPPNCGICGKIGKEYICKECYDIMQQYILQDNYPKDRFHLLKYENLVREKMIDYKFNDQAYLYKMFCEMILKNKKACDFITQYDIIIPVPIHKKRKQTRGYNQSELIARYLALNLNKTIYTDVLKKEVNNVPQSTLGKEKRKNNIKNVYSVKHPEKIKGKSICIFDDIYTTGMTVGECKEVLAKIGTKQIGVMTLAKD